MQVVDVLGDHGFEEAPLFEPSQDPVSLVGFGLGEVLVENFFKDPPAILGVLMKIREFEVFWIVAAPQAIRSTKRRNPALHGYPGPGVSNKMAGRANNAGTLADSNFFR